MKNALALSAISQVMSGDINQPRTLKEAYSMPIYIPKRHTVESYRQQQRRAKQRKKQHK